MDDTVSTSPSSPLRRRLRHGWPLLALAAALIGWYALSQPTLTAAAESPKPPPSVPATVARVQREDVPRFLAGVGTVQPMATVTVKSRIDGQLERIGYSEGQDVKAGQVLAELDARPIQAQIDQLQAQKARDEAQLANARLDLERYSQLIQEEAASRQQVDTQRALVAQLQAAVRNDDAQIRYQQVQLGYTRITAPLSGRVGAKLVDPGNIVRAADANGLVVINQIDPIAVNFTLPGDAVPAVQQAQREGKGLKVQAYARQGDQLLAEGDLVLVNNQIDVASGTVLLKARFVNAKQALWPGQYVNVRLHLGTLAQALTVPASTVQRGPAGTYAYAVDEEGKAQIRPIDVLQIQDGKAVVAKGLAAGDTVVVDGQYKLRPGVKVAAAKPDRQASGT